MTDQQHPITPPEDMCSYLLGSGKTFYEMLTEAARWGADQELEACCAWLNFYAADAEAQDLRAARRPKPRSLAEEALAALKRQSTRSVPSLVATQDCDTIRRALKRLQELEGQGDD